MSKKLPAIQFYTGDWLKDPALSMCSASTRGIWVDLLCCMHESGRSGRLRGTEEQLSRLGRCTVEEMRKALEELAAQKAGLVARADGCVTVTNKRMLREHNERRQAALRQRQYRSHDGVTVGETKERRSYTSSSSSNTPLPPLPDGLADTRLNELWQAFGRHRSELRKPLTPQAATLTIRKLEKWGTARAIIALEHSIANGWQGVFEPTGEAAKSAAPKKLRSEMTPEEVADFGRNYRA